MDEPRKDPEAYLSLLTEEDADHARGRLKLFFGYAAGVGKTYTMLQEARQLQAEGEDVVVGYAEAHGRVETLALLAGLEILPQKDVEYRGNSLQEFDLDAALARKPQLILVDELAHTNAPGSRHAKRWQDVQELLDAGIDVYTALNVQHLESLHDQVAQITRIQVRERIPDSFLERADEIELVDLPTDDLLQRLREGKVYIGERAASALENFFQKGNLIALREMSMRFAAEQVDAQMDRYRAVRRIKAPWPVADRIVVCVSASPLSMKLVRAARRMATALRARWLVVSVQKTGQQATATPECDRVSETLRVAEQLGAEVMQVTGDNVANEIVKCARQFNASKIIVGKPATARWKEILFGSVLDEIVRQSGAIDVYVITGDEGGPPGSQPRKWRSHSRPSRYAASVLMVAICSGIGYLMQPTFELINVVMVYLLGTVLVAVRSGRGPSILASILSVAAFDFFFVPPQWTFAVSDTQYLVTFGVMLTVAVLISTLTARVRQQAEDASLRERRTAALYSMSRELASTEDVHGLLAIGMRHISEVFDGSVATLLPDDEQPPARTIKPPQSKQALSNVDPAVAQWVQHNRQMAGLGTDTLPGADALYVPLPGTNRDIGVLAISPHEKQKFARPEQMQLLQTFAHQLAQACERAYLAHENEQSRIQIKEEQLRSTLLSSVSHDLRTPLATIAGAASSIVEAPTSIDVESCKERAEEIYNESVRLNRLVTNLLDMTKLESGTLRVTKEWYPVDELIGAALTSVDDRLGEREVKTDVSSGLPLVPADSVLVQQLLVNLLENAIKYTPENSPIDITAVEQDDNVVISVGDHGPGISSENKAKVFQKFFRAGKQTGPGAGLGLAIASGIAEAHGGRLWIEDNTDGGALFRFTLPIGDKAPVEPVEEFRND